MQVGLESGKPMRKLSQWSRLKDCENRDKGGLDENRLDFQSDKGVRVESNQKMIFKQLVALEECWHIEEEKGNGKEGDLEKNIGFGPHEWLCESNRNGG